VFWQFTSASSLGAAGIYRIPLSGGTPVRVADSSGLHLVDGAWATTARTAGMLGAIGGADTRIELRKPGHR